MQTQPHPTSLYKNQTSLPVHIKPHHYRTRYHSIQDKMQSSSSIPVLTLVLCCMASAHNASAKERQSCNLPEDIPQNCLDAISDYDTSRNLTATSSALDTLCSDTCSNQLGPYYECLFVFNSEYLCARLNDQYCLVIGSNYAECLGINCIAGCSDDCRSCLDGFVNDISCCLTYISSSSIPDSAIITTDVCGNSYDTCSGGAIAVPTVLTALLLMVMAAIVM